jgi:hypothetical protein
MVNESKGNAAKMKKRRYAVILLICLGLAAVLSACQPTPEKQPVAEKGDLEQTIIDKTVETPQTEANATDNAGAAGNVNVSENVDKAEPVFIWKEDYIDKKGIFKVKINAAVIKPDVTSFPAVRLELSQFSDEQLSKAVTAFFDEGPIYDGNIAPTKSELAESIIKLKAEQQDPNVKIDENYLKYLEDAYKSAPEDVELKQTQPVWKESHGTNEISIIQMRDGGERARIDGLSSEKGNCYISFEYGSGHYFPAGKLNGKPNGVSMKPDEAEREVMNAAGQLGLKDYKIVSKAVGGLMDMDPRNMDPRNPSNEKQCYIFYLSKTIGGIPFTYVRSAEGEFMTDEKPYAPPVNQETIEIHISDSGVIYFSWYNPYEQAEYVSNNVELLDFEEIKSIFLTQMKRVGEGRNEWYSTNGKTDDTINIERVELGMMVTIDKDEPDRFLSIPVWDFFASNSDMGEETDYSILTVNAIDGGIINRNLGY